MGKLKSKPPQTIYPDNIAPTGNLLGNDSWHHSAKLGKEYLQASSPEQNFLDWLRIQTWNKDLPKWWLKPKVSKYEFSSTWMGT